MWYMDIKRAMFFYFCQCMLVIYVNVPSPILLVLSAK